VLVDRPDKGRLDILKVHVKKDAGPDVDLEQVAALTTGFSGATSPIWSTRRRWRRGDAVRPPWNCRTSPRPSSASWRAWKEEARAQSQEARNRGPSRDGLALVALALPETDPCTRSRSSRAASARGLPCRRPTEDRFLMTRTDREHKIAVLLGGVPPKAGVRRVVPGRRTIWREPPTSPAT
jgi:cell division protease FtsH